MAARKKEFLPVTEIYKYQHANAAEIERLFTNFGVKNGAHLFYLMLKSFQLTARVANAAFGFMKEWRAKSNGIFIEEEKLSAALHDYSPDNFDPPNTAYEFAADCFEQFYNEACTKSSKEEVEELIFQWTQKLRERAAQPA